MKYNSHFGINASMARRAYASYAIFLVTYLLNFNILRITTGGLKHLDPSFFRQTSASDEMTLVVNWEQRLTWVTGIVLTCHCHKSYNSLVLFLQSAPKASELVPCSLLPHWNSMRFFATVSLSDMNSLQEVKFATLYRQSSNTSRIL